MDQSFCLGKGRATHPINCHVEIVQLSLRVIKEYQISGVSPGHYKGIGRRRSWLKSKGCSRILVDGAWRATEPYPKASRLTGRYSLPGSSQVSKCLPPPEGDRFLVRTQSRAIQPSLHLVDLTRQGKDTKLCVKEMRDNTTADRMNKALTVIETKEN